MTRMLAIANLRLELSKIRESNMTKEEKTKQSRDHVNAFYLQAVELWPHKNEDELRTLLQQALPRGVEFISTRQEAHDGNGFCVEWTKIEELCAVLGINFDERNIATASWRFKTVMKQCGLKVYSLDPKKVYCYHEFIRPGDDGQRLAKLLTLDAKSSIKDMELYAPVPQDIVEDKGDEAKCELNTCTSRSQLTRTAEFFD